MKRKKKQRIIARGIFRSLAPPTSHPAFDVDAVPSRRSPGFCTCKLASTRFLTCKLTCAPPMGNCFTCLQLSASAVATPTPCHSSLYVVVVCAAHASGSTNSWRLLLESAIFCAPLLVVLGACPLSRRFSQSCFFCQFLPFNFGYVCVCDV